MLLIPAALISVSPGVYWLTFGLVLVVMGFLLARNVHGGAANMASRWGTILFTVSHGSEA